MDPKPPNENGNVVQVKIENVSLEIGIRLNGPDTREKFEHIFDTIKQLKSKFGPDTLFNELSACLIGEIESVRITGGTRIFERGSPERVGSILPAPQGASRTAPGGHMGAGMGQPNSFHGIQPHPVQGNQQFPNGGARPAPEPVWNNPSAGQPNQGIGGTVRGVVPGQLNTRNNSQHQEGPREEQAPGLYILQSPRFERGTAIQFLDPAFLDNIIRTETHTLLENDYHAIIKFLTQPKTCGNITTQGPIPLDKDEVPFI